MTAIILAGGKSSRFGRDKAFAEIQGMPVVARQIRILAGIFEKIVIVTNRPARYRLRGVKVIGDLIPHKGPLGGIYSGLKASGSFYNFVVACDMPFLNTDVVRYMLKEAAGYDAAVPRFRARWHPLHAVYAKGCLAAAQTMIKEGGLRVSDLFDHLNVRTISEREIRRFDPRGICLTNMNTPGEYRLLTRQGAFARDAHRQP